ncbi:MAG TPA: alpha/beta fold hydrolase [Ilumatobacteraceae bacterium]|nr:alpha/beta fold hydrolase [Ilumatobacteraceae bacterium]
MSDWRPLEGELAGWTCGQGPRLIFVHGFTQTSNSWKPIAERFATNGYEAIVVDVPGHGGSSSTRADLRAAAGMLTAMCGSGVYVGYSLGGRLCMQVATMYPDLVRALAMIGGSPGIADDIERAERRLADEKLADHIVEVGVDTFLDEWLALPLFAGLTADDQQRADRLTNTADGLASSLRLAGTGAQDSLWPRLHEMNMPVLTIAGELDRKFAASGREVAASVPDGEYLEIPGAGHAAHLQEPERVVEALTGWLREIKY